MNPVTLKHQAPLPPVFAVGLYLVAFGLGVSAVPIPQGDLVLILDAPRKVATDTMTVTIQGVSATVDFSAQQPLTQETKAKALAKALNATGKFNAEARQEPNRGFEVTVEVKDRTARGKTEAMFTPGGNKTMERDGKWIIPFKVFDGKLSFGYEGNPTGIFDVGLESVYRVSLGFEGFSVTSSVTFDSLPSSPTIDDLLAAVYADLRDEISRSSQPFLISNLNSPDLVNDMITFRLPNGVVSPFVENFSSDVSTVPTLAITAGRTESVPDTASSLMLFGIGSGSLFGCGWWLRRPEVRVVAAQTEKV